MGNHDPYSDRRLRWRCGSPSAPLGASAHRDDKRAPASPLNKVSRPALRTYRPEDALRSRGGEN